MYVILIIRDKLATWQYNQLCISDQEHCSDNLNVCRKYAYKDVIMTNRTNRLGKDLIILNQSNLPIGLFLKLESFWNSCLQILSILCFEIFAGMYGQRFEAKSEHNKYQTNNNPYQGSDVCNAQVQVQRR